MVAGSGTRGACGHLALERGGNELYRMRPRTAGRRQDESVSEGPSDPPRGFTWVEVMLAILLLAVGLLAIAPLFLVAAKSSAAAADLSAVGTRAAYRMEVLRLLPFDELTVGGDLASDADGFFDASDPGCVLRWRITDGAAPAVTVTRKTITVVGLAARRPVGLQREVRLTVVRAR